MLEELLALESPVRVVKEEKDLVDLREENLADSRIPGPQLQLKFANGRTGHDDCLLVPVQHDMMRPILRAFQSQAGRNIEHGGLGEKRCALCSWHRAQCTLHENPVSQETHSISGKNDDEIMWNPVFVFWLTLTHCFNHQPKPNPPTPLAAGGARQRRNYQQQGARSCYKQQGARSKKWGIQAVRQSGRRLRARSVLQ